MSALFLIASRDGALIASWSQQLPEGSTVRILKINTNSAGIDFALPCVLLVDSSQLSQFSELTQLVPTIIIGASLDFPAFETLPKHRFSLLLTHDESLAKLRLFTTLFAQYAEQSALVSLLTKRAERRQVLHTQQPSTYSTYHGSSNPWGLLDSALENVTSKGHLFTNFGWIYRQQFGTSRITFLFRDSKGFSNHEATISLADTDPIVDYLTHNPSVIDGIHWPVEPAPIVELATRNWLALLSAKILIPIQVNGGLLAIVGCGPRRDGIAYDDCNKQEIAAISRILYCLMNWYDRIEVLNRDIEKRRLQDMLRPKIEILRRGDNLPPSLPLVVRAIASSILAKREPEESFPTLDQPLRVKGGVLEDSGDIWVSWEDVSSEVYRMHSMARAERIAMLKEISLTLNHEIGNALVSLAMLEKPMLALPVSLRNAIQVDVRRLTVLNDQMVQLAGIAEANIASVDMRDFVIALGEKYKMRIESPPLPVILHIAPKLVEFALDSIVAAIVENRSDILDPDLFIQLVAVGISLPIKALIAIRGPKLELEGILPSDGTNSVPNHGRISLFVAKEILKLHGGSIHSGPGIEGSEILISVQRW